MRSPATTSFAAPARGKLLSACTSAVALVLASASHGQVAQPPAAVGSVPGYAAQTPAPVDPESLSCSDLKAELKSTGQLNLLYGPRGGWGDTFYGPAAPRCQFWQMPQFTYVRARDGLCGIGYICVDKLSFD